MMRGMSRTTMSHAAMRALSAVSALTETRRDEPREVTEAAPHHCARIRAANSRCDSDLGHLAALECDGQVGRPAARVRTDAVAGWTRVRRVGGESRKWSRRGAAFRWIYLPVALYRRLPTDLEIRHLPGGSAVLYFDGARGGSDNRDIPAGTLAPGTRCRIDCSVIARVLTCVHHLFSACDERRSHFERNDLRRRNARDSDCRGRSSIELVANLAVVGIRSLGGVLDDHPA